MKNFVIYLLCAAMVLGAAFCFSEFVLGTAPIMKSDIADIMGVAVFENHTKSYLPEEYFSDGGETENAIIDILMKGERKHIPSLPEPIEGARTDYEIDVYFSSLYEHYSFYLGQNSIAYNMKTQKSYEIVNGEELISLLDSLLSE